MKTFKDVLNEFVGKEAAQRLNKYNRQLTSKLPLNPSTRAQRDAARAATGGGYSTVVDAASQGKIKKPGGETVTANDAAQTSRRAARHAAAKWAKR